LTSTLPGVRLILGSVHRIDRAARTVHFTDPEGGAGTVDFDRLIVTVGSVNKVLPVPGIACPAERQGRAVARNVAASLGYGSRRAYRHRDLGLVVDLGGLQAVAEPLGVPLAGIPAKVATRGYHLLAMPANRFRILLDWIVDAFTRRQAVQLGLVRSAAVPLQSAEPELPRPPVPAHPAITAAPRNRG
jgi:NADH dehydrogenase